MTGPLVCVVDDDDAVRLSMGLLIETLGLPVRCFPTALDVLADGVRVPAGARLSHAAVVRREDVASGAPGRASGDLWIAPLDTAAS